MNYWDDATIEKIRRGFYSAVYFNRTQGILLQEKHHKIITMQVFQKNDALLCGVNQVFELLKIGTGYYEKENWIDKSQTLEILTLADGDAIAPKEPVMHIKGPYAYFAPLESLYLGILARQTNIATNTKRVVKAANGKQVIFFADRFDYFLNQEIDGYAARMGGVSGVATPAQASLWEGSPMGTIPHSLIGVYDGHTIAAAEQFAKHFPDVPLTVLVDFDNDCVTTALAVAKRFGPKLFAVRLDTSETMIDASLKKMDEPSLTGVNALLVKSVRNALDKEGFPQIKIVVSGGFTAEKIAQFEREKVPVDIYGVGSSLLKGGNDFTADCVQVDGMNLAKVGRKYINNKRLRTKPL
jgi:nicotinate phosphoribosyltransferase